MTDPDLARLQQIVQHREALRPRFAAAWRALAHADQALRRDWVAATLALVDVNAGLDCMQAFWRLDPPDPAAGLAAAALCRHAGARAALACLDALPAVRSMLGQAGLPIWWQAMTRLAQEAPRLVQPIAGRVGSLLGAGDAAAFADFVAAALKATAGDKSRRAAVFAGTDPLAETLLAGASGRVGFMAVEPMLAAFVAGLWGGVPRLRALPFTPGGTMARPALAAGTVLLPGYFPGVAPERTRALYRAAVAHAQAHLAASPSRLPVGSLRPVQRVLIGLVEDARVEALAIRRFPGLRTLWSVWHDDPPGGGATGLLRRLSRALLDPAYADPDGFVAKGRALFAAADLGDPAISRAIGGLLGNDLGQMRLPFDGRAYVPEPLYRDDNNHLWELPETPDDRLALSVETARAQPAPPPAGRSPPGGTDDRPAVIATYPEWDAAARALRPHWVTVRDVLPRRAAPPVADPRLNARLARLIRGVTVGRRRRPPSLHGDVLDLDRAIAAAAAHRAGLEPDLRLYREHTRAGRDLSTLLILDTSHSTGIRIRSGETVLDLQRQAAAALAAALSRAGSSFALRSFASAGREDVRVTRLKDFDEPHGPAVSERLAGLRAGLSTRLGAALRHAGAEIASRPTARKLVLVLTDGEPSDIDAAPADLREDARRAARELRLRSIDTVGVVVGLDGEALGGGSTVFGRRNTIVVRHLGELPRRLAETYFRLSQR